MSRRRIVLLVILLVAAVFRIGASSVPRMNVDEGWSYYLCLNHPPRQIMWYLQKDRHPPLPYLMLKAIMESGGHNEVRLRMPFALIAIVNVWLVFLLGRRLFDRDVGLGAAALTAVSFLSWEYETWMRGYVLLTCFSLCATIAFLGLVASDGRRRVAWTFAYTLSGAALMYSQYLGLLTLLAHFVYVVMMGFSSTKTASPSSSDSADVDPTAVTPVSVRAARPALAVAWLLMALLYLPWTPILKLQLHHREARDLGASGQPLLAADMLLRLLPLETGLDNVAALAPQAWQQRALLSFFSAAVLWMFLAGMSALRDRRSSTRLLTLLGGPPLLFILLIAIKFPELNRVRYYAPYIPFFGMALSASLTCKPRSRFRRNVFMILAIFIGIANAAVLTSYLHSVYFRSADWLTPARFATAHERDAQMIVGCDNHMMHAFNYYYARDLVHYDIADVDHPSYSYAPAYAREGKLPQWRAWEEEFNGQSAPQDAADVHLKNVDRLVLILYMQFGGPVTDWFASHYSVAGEAAIGVQTRQPDGCSVSMLLRRK